MIRQPRRYRRRLDLLRHIAESPETYPPFLVEQQAILLLEAIRGGPLRACAAILASAARGIRHRLEWRCRRSLCRHLGIHWLDLDGECFFCGRQSHR